MDKAGFQPMGVDALTTNLDSGVNPVRSRRSFLNNVLSVWGRRVTRLVASINLNRGKNISEMESPAVTYKKGNGSTGKVTSVDSGADVKAQSASENVPRREHAPLGKKFSLHEDILIGVGLSTDNQHVVEVRDRRTGALYVAKPIMGGDAKNREIEFLQKLKGDNSKYIANIIAIHKGHIIMENGGTTLKEIIKDNGALDKERVGNCIAQLINGLCFLSEKGIVHGDIKPDNLLLRNEQLKICDLGMAREPREDYRGKVPVSYTPLECFTHGQSENMDIWSAGCVLYFLTTGQRLFPADFMLDSDCQLKVTVTDQYMEERINEASDLIGTKLGEDAKDLFRKMMELKSRNRITPIRAVQHRYIKAAEQKLVQFQSARVSSQGDAIAAAGKYIPGRSINGREDELERAGFCTAEVSRQERAITGGVEAGKLFSGSAFENLEYMKPSRFQNPKSYDGSEYINVGAKYYNAPL